MVKATLSLLLGLLRDSKAIQSYYPMPAKDWAETRPMLDLLGQEYAAVQVNSLAHVLTTATLKREISSSGEPFASALVWTFGFAWEASSVQLSHGWTDQVQRLAASVKAEPTSLLSGFRKVGIC